jgi:hypothetical protein
MDGLRARAERFGVELCAELVADDVAEVHFTGDPKVVKTAGDTFLSRFGFKATLAGLTWAARASARTARSARPACSSRRATTRAC